MRDIEVEVGAAVTARRTIRWRRIERLISARACDNDLLVGYLKRQRDAPPLHEPAHQCTLAISKRMDAFDGDHVYCRERRHQEAPFRRTRMPRRDIHHPAMRAARVLWPWLDAIELNVGSRHTGRCAHPGGRRPTKRSHIITCMKKKNRVSQEGDTDTKCPLTLRFTIRWSLSLSPT